MIYLDWSEFKQQVPNVGMIRCVDRLEFYSLVYMDEGGGFDCSIVKDNGDDHLDFENNYKESCNKIYNSKDKDTGGINFSPKFAPDGWHQQYFETEFETCTMNSIHEKDWTNQDLGFSSLKFYKIVNGVEVECDDQSDIDANCIRTDLLWMPPFDYAIKSGWVSQKAIPASNMYVWALGADLDAAYGGPQAVFAEGGINLTFVDARTRAGLDGVSATVLQYNHPQLGDGAGTNRMRFVVRHAAGLKHRIQAVFELFLE